MFTVNNANQLETQGTRETELLSKPRSHALLAFLILVALWATGCSRRGEYAVENETTAELTEVTVAIGTTHRCMHGILIPNTHSSYSGPIAGSGNLPVEISWRVNANTALTNRTSVPANALRKELNVQFLITSTGAVARIAGK